MNIKNRTIFCNDNLYVLRGLDDECIDLIYLDPPFNSNATYSAPIGSEAAGASFKDTWTLSDVDNAWHGEIADREPALYQAIHAAELTHSKGMKSYLIMMAIRLIEMKRVLKDTGSIYLHCDSTASHYLKLVMDSVFGKDNFRNEISWVYGKVSNSKANKFLRGHDTILFYRKSHKSTYNIMFEDQISLRKQQLIKSGYNTKRQNGKRYLYIYDENVFNKKQIDKNDFDVVRYVDTTHGNRFTDVFNINLLNSNSKEYVGYPTQKPLNLLERIILASSNQGDVVLDPFCGCATTCVAAEKLGRQWVGVDISSLAAKLVRSRLENEVGFLGTVISRDDIPKRSEKFPKYTSFKHALYGVQEGVCNGCEIHFPFRNMTVDHIVPQTHGGQDNEENLQLLCAACNSKKNKGTQAQLKAGLKEEGVL